MSEDRPSHFRLYSLVGLMTLLWAGNFVAAKFALREIPPMLAVGLRMILAAACMIPVRSGPAPKWTKGDLARVLVLGVLGVGLNQAFFVMGLARTSVAHAAIIIGLSPMVVLLLATASKQERLSAPRLLGMVIALGGVAAIQFGSAGSKSSSFVGDLLVFLGASTFSIYTVAGKTMAQKFGSVTVNTYAYIASAIVLLPVTIRASSGFQPANVSWVAWVSLLYMAALSSALCYVIYYYALAHVPASRVSAFSYLQPVIATLLAIPLLGEYPAQSLMFGGALVFAGVVVAERT